jgi:hypothetical protein
MGEEVERRWEGGGEVGVEGVGGGRVGWSGREENQARRDKERIPLKK